MKKKVLFIISALVLCSSYPAAWSQKKEITLTDILAKNTFSTQSVPGFNNMSNENHYSALRKDNSSGKTIVYITQYDITTRKATQDIINVTEIMSDVQPEAVLETYKFSADESQILLSFDGESIYRHSRKYDTYLYNRKTKELTHVDQTPLLHVTFSPQGDQLAYVKDNNLYIYDIADKHATAITTDGQWNNIINGNCDWVYEEEFSFTQAYQWSPDGQHIAYYRFDESHVKEYTMALYNTMYPTQYSFKYPKAGEDNSIVTINMYSVANNDTYPIDLGDNTDIYIPRIKWANDHELLILRLNRLQNHLEYIFHNLNTNINHIALDDKSDTYVDILDPIVFYNNGQNMLYLSEKSGYLHIHDFNRKTRQDTDLIKDNYDVNKTLGYNKEKHSVYFLASPNDPMNNGLYAVSLANKNIRTITDNPGWHQVTAFPSVTKFMVNHSHVNQAPLITLINDNGETIQTLEDNRTAGEKRRDYNFGQVEFKTLLAADGRTTLNGYLILPHDFDSNKKYPVLMYQYSGPGSQEVKNAYSLGHGNWHHYLTTQGYIIACFDGRGTGNRGESFKKMTYLELGKLESDDQIAIGRQLGDLSFVDKTRLGIWGWSFGGFVSSICILKGNDVFKTAISVAPVTHWALYDNIYTERFMRKPTENKSGYDNNSPLSMVDNLKGNFLLIHGTADDNVHFQNAVLLTDALIKSNKQFESTYYPDGNHGIGGGVVREQLYRKMTDYLLKNL